MYQVMKRDGKLAEFDINKIADAIAKAFDAQNKPYNRSTVAFIALRVTADFEDKIHDDVVDVEAIQDSVEHVLGEIRFVRHAGSREEVAVTGGDFAAQRQTRIARVAEYGGICLIQHHGHLRTPRMRLA